MARLEADGSETLLTDQYQGTRYIAPNDVCIDARGRIFFTDPYYGPRDVKPLPQAAVYRIDSQPGEGGGGKRFKVTRVIDNLLKPNGIAITPDGKRLYVSDRGTQKLHRYVIGPDGSLKVDSSLKAGGVVYDFSPDRGIDGMALDVAGNIYGAAGQGKTTGLFVISPKGKLLLHKPMPEFSTNVTFGGKDMRDLYLTASTSVYHMRTKNAGMKIPPVGK